MNLVAAYLPKRKPELPENATRFLPQKDFSIIQKAFALDGKSEDAETVASPNGQVKLETAQSRRPQLLVSHKTRRHLGWAIACVVLLLVCVPIGLWINYQSNNVVSRNAMVRGHLTEIGTRLNGVLAEIEVGEGERVAAGQVLAHLEDGHIRAEAMEAKAELDGLKLELGVERLAITHEQRLLDNKLQEAVANLAAAEAEVAAAKSRAEDAQQFHEVRKALLNRNSISKEDVRDANNKSITALALLRVAEADRAAALSAEETARLNSKALAIRKQRIGVLQANVVRARARLDGINADLEGSLIRAPNDGAVIRWLVRQGGSVEVGKPVMSMWVGKDVWVEAWIDEHEISKVKVGSEAIVTLQSFPGREFTAVVDKIGLTTDFEMPAADVPQPRFARMRGAPVVGVLVRLYNPPETLLPGLSAVVAIRSSAS